MIHFSRSTCRCDWRRAHVGPWEPAHSDRTARLECAPFRDNTSRDRAGSRRARVLTSAGRRLELSTPAQFAKLLAQTDFVRRAEGKLIKGIEVPSRPCRKMMQVRSFSAGLGQSLEKCHARQLCSAARCPVARWPCLESQH